MCFHNFAGVFLPATPFCNIDTRQIAHVPRTDLPRTFPLLTHAEMPEWMHQYHTCAFAGAYGGNTRTEEIMDFFFFFASLNVNKHLPFDSTVAVTSAGIIDATRRNPSGVMFIRGGVGGSQRPQKLINCVRHRV